MHHGERVVSFVVFVFFAIPVLKTAAADNGQIPALFSFGDSILDTGNNNNLLTFTKCNYPPYGRDFYGGIATGRFCDGRNPSDLIVEALGIKATLPAYLDPNLRTQDLPSGVSFASGGSGIDDLTSQFQGVLSLSTQLGMFRDYIGRLRAVVGQERTSYIISNSLYLISAGNNDIAITYYATLGKLQPFSTYANTLVGGASSFVKSLYELGARRVWVLSTLPLGCLPGGRTVAGGPLRFCAPIANQQAQFFNGQLSAAVDSIRSSLTNLDIRFIDVYTPLLSLIQNPQPEGFMDVSEGCCGTGLLGVSGACSLLSVCPNAATYVFWDYAHPTERAYQFVVSSVLNSFNASTSFGFSPVNSSLSH